LLVAGAGLLLYPRIAEYFFERQVEEIKKEFLQSRERNKSLFDELYEFLKAENKRLFETGQDGLVDAFSYERPAIDLSEYGIMDNRIGFISLPTINMELPIYLGASEENLKKGAVHMTQTSYPIGGNNTNSVIAAHRGTYLVMFLYIHNLKIGDEIIITNFRETLTYRMTEYKIIRPTDINKILIQNDRDMLTLFTCTPLGGFYDRYVVYCERVTE